VPFIAAARAMAEAAEKGLNLRVDPVSKELTDAGPVDAAAG